MSFNKRYLPEMKDLVKMRERYSSDKEFLDFIEGYLRNADAVMGSPESFDYIKEMKERTEGEQKLGE